MMTKLSFLDTFTHFHNTVHKQTSPYLCKEIFVAAYGMVKSLDQKSMELFENQAKAFNLLGGSAGTVVSLQWAPHSISICKADQIRASPN